MSLDTLFKYDLHLTYEEFQKESTIDIWNKFKEKYQSFQENINHIISTETYYYIHQEYWSNKIKEQHLNNKTFILPDSSVTKLIYTPYT